MQRLANSRIILALVLGLVPFKAAAQLPQRDDGRSQVDFAGLDIQAVAGWDGFVDTSAPVAFSFLISNYSDQVIEGQLILSDLINEREVILGDIFIGPNSVKRFSSVQAIPDWDQCQATLVGGERIYWSRELAIATGRDFSDDCHYLLFVDDSGRMLQLPVGESAPAGPSSRYTPKPGQGRPVQPLAVRSWQIPQHPGPMTVAQAMVFSETATSEMLNDSQWDAVGRWICLGGTAFVSDQSAELIDRLKKAVPLAVPPAVPFEQLMVHRCGNGSVREYAGPLFSATNTEPPRLIAEAASRLSRYNTMTMLDSTIPARRQNQNSQKNRILVVAVYGCYMLLSGVTLLFFRISRRRLAIYTVCVVGAACMATVVLGRVLRTSYGDLQWETITCAGPGGLVQLAKIEVQSAGGRNTQMTVRGLKPDLQLIDAETDSFRPYYYYLWPSEFSRSGYPPFTWQASRLPEEPGAFQINVPITPWGRRQIYGAAFDPSVHALDVELKYQGPEGAPEEGDAVSQQSNGIPGQFRVTLTNRLPFDLSDCRLVIGRTSVILVADETIRSYDPRTRRFRTRDAESIGELMHIESVVSLGDLPMSGTLREIAANLVDPSHHESGRQLWYDLPHMQLPRIPYDGATMAWIVARISRSHILSVDESQTDFEPISEQHLFLQAIEPEDMPPEWLQLHQQILEQQMRAAAEKRSP